MKRKIKPSDKRLESECHNVLEDLADFLLKESSSPDEEIEDPFEDYIKRVKAHIYSDSSRFRERFAEGFRVLMKEIDHFSS